MLLSETTLRKQTASILAKKHIHTSDDLARFVPRHYYDYRTVKMLQDVTPGDRAAVSGLLLNVSLKQMKNRDKDYMFALVRQDDGTKFNVIWFSNVYLFDSFKSMEGKPVYVAGKINYDEKYGYTISDPDRFDLMLNFQPYIYKKYTKFSGISVDMMHRLIKAGLKYAEEPLDILPPGMIGYKEALNKIHYANTPEEAEEGANRLLYNDLLYFSILLQKNNPGKEESQISLVCNKPVKDFIASLPFELTKDQKACIRDMFDTAKDGKRINVLLQGDVGCGKTIVAAIMMMCAAQAGYQSVLMAPRQVLARQHYEEIKRYAESAGIEAVFLHSGMKASEKKKVLEQIKEGKAKFIIGTHSCLSEAVEYQNLGLIVTDEEHLFGVQQKEALARKAEEGVHSISMSATPIPRTVASVLYGDSKKILTIKTKPAGRKEIKTSYTADRAWVLHFIKEQIDQGHQCYVVCPAIEEDEDSPLTSVEEIEKLYKTYFEPKGIKVGTVHGKMKKEDVEETISSFSRNECKILISTTVIEVGVNVPNSTVMVVEQAERFGLASLHQLRGRVGRSDLQSYCILISEEKDNERLKVMTETNDGFVIAEADLKQRGSGNLIGNEQSGFNKYVNMMLNHPDMYDKVKDTAKYYIANNLGQKLIALHEEHDNAEKEAEERKKL